LNGIITRRTGLTKTDDAYLVNTSHLFVTQPRFVTDHAILKRGINTEGVNLGFAGNSGVISATDYRGVPVITVYRWLPKRQLCLIVEIDQEEAFATPRVFGKTIIIIAGFVLLLASLIAFVVARTINRPILVLKDGAVRFGKGDLNFRLPVSSEDEIGLLTKEFNIMAVNLTEKESKLHAYAGQLEQMVESRTAKLKLSEESLRESEQKFRSLIEDAPEAIFVHADARFIYLNPAAVSLFGAKEADQFIGCPITERFYPDYHEMIQERMRLLYEEHKKLPAIEQIYLRLDGSSVPVEVQAVPINYDNQSAALTFVRDITRRKAAEAALQASIDEVRTISQQLWQAAKLATMGELASSIAHELNNPLATVSLRIESLTAQTSADNVRRRELEIIGQEVERMGNLVTNLLQFSRRSQKQVSTLDTREEIEKTLELIHYHLRKNNIQVIREFAPEVPGILADRQQLRQLFLNLFTNAGDAMPKGGTLTIRVYAQGSGGRDQGSGVRSSPDPRFPTPFVVIEIVDTGTGIPPEILPKVMEPFYTTKPEGRGTGLGLAICRRIAQEHGGSFDITSEGIPGTGTKVRITLQSLDQGNSIGLLDP
ncbi:MAG: ATP-binding protein, partial [Lentisphaerota bacterium]